MVSERHLIGPEEARKNREQLAVKLYESQAIDELLGGTLRPGGVKLTARIAEFGGLDENSFVLDIGCGKGTSVFFLAENYGCRVLGIDRSDMMVSRAQNCAEKESSKKRVYFTVGDGGLLPFFDASFDMVFSECSFSLLPDKGRALKEIKRVLRPKGRLAMTDITLKKEIVKEFRDQLTFLPCVSGAETRERYLELVEKAGFTSLHFEDHSEDLKEIGFKIFFLFGSPEAFLTKLTSSSFFGKEGLTPFPSSLDGFKKIFKEKMIGYALIAATRP